MTERRIEALDESGHRYVSRTYGSRVVQDGPKTGTPSAGFTPKGARPAGDPKGETPER